MNDDKRTDVLAQMLTTDEVLQSIIEEAGKLKAIDPEMPGAEKTELARVLNTLLKMVKAGR